MIPLSDLTLGSRMWVTSDLAALQGIFDQAEAIDGTSSAPLEQVSAKAVPSVISDDAVLTSLAAGPTSAKLKGVFAGAKLLGRLIEKDADSKLQIERCAANVANLLGIDREGLTKTIARMNRIVTHATSTLDLTADELALAGNALDKILGSSEMDQRSAKGKLTKQGRLALANAALGVLKLMRDGVLGPDSTTELFDNELFDIAKPGDMLKLSAKTAQTARRLFVDEESLKGLVDHLQAAISQKFTDKEESFAANGLLFRLQSHINALIQKRENVSKILDFEPNFGDGSEKAVKKGLHDAKNAMRAFRYDFDQVTGRDMGKMERFRRMIDNLHSRNGGGQVSCADYRELCDLEAQVTRLVDDISQACGLTEKIELPTSAQTSERAANLTHATNNMIRYCESGIAAEKEKAIRSICEGLEGIDQDGGLKKVSFGVGFDAKFAVKVSDAAAVEAHAELKYERSATVSVGLGGSPVSVTYYDGGAIGADAKGTVGTWGDKKDVGSISGGAKVSGKIGGGFGKGETVVYASVRDFAEDVWGRRGESVTRQKSYGQPLCLGRIMQGIRALGHGVVNLVTAMGFRIHHTKIDAAAFRAQLRSSGAIAATDRILAAPLHERVVKVSEKTFKLARFTAGVQADVKIETVHSFKASAADPNTKEAQPSELFSGHAGIGYTGERTFATKGAEFRSRLNTLRLQSHEYLLERLEKLRSKADYADLVVPAFQPDAPSQEAARIARQKQFKALDENLSKIEDSTDNLSPDSTDAWKKIARQYRFLSIQYALIEQEITSTLNALREEDEEGNKEQIDALQDELKNATTFFERRLTAPNLNMPDDVFNEQLVETTTHTSRNSARHKVEFSLGYSALTGALGDFAGDQIKGNNFNAELQRAETATAINTVGNELMLSNEVTGSVSTEMPTTTTDVRPWRNVRTTDVAIKLNANLPVKAIVEAVARKYIDTHLDDPKVTPALKIALEAAVLDGVSMIFGPFINVGVKNLMTLTVGEIAKQMAKGGAAGKAAELFGAPFLEAATGITEYAGLVIGGEMNFFKEFVFHFEGSRLASLALEDGESARGELGFRIPLTGSAGFGLVMSSATERKKVERWVYPHPSFDTMLARTEDFLQAGNSQGLKDFLAHNSHGALRLVGLLGKDETSLAESKNGNDRDDVRAMRERHRFVTRAIDNIIRINAGFGPGRVDRAKTILHDLELSAEALRKANTDSPDMTDAKKLKALESHMSALVKGFALLREIPANLRQSVIPDVGAAEQDV